MPVTTNDDARIEVVSRQSKPVEREIERAGLHEHLQAANDWDASRNLLIERSERRAWIIACVAIAVAVLSVITIALMLPLKKTEPYVVRVDSVTGVPDIITVLDEKKISTDDAINKHFMAQYILARETYDYYTLQNDYDKVFIFSNNVVGSEYAKIFEGDNPLDKRYGNRIKEEVEIISVVPQGKRTGQVRFIKRTSKVGTGEPPAEKKWIATIAFEYRGTQKLEESKRLINPFGFQVKSYRVDPELN